MTTEQVCLKCFGPYNRSTRDKMFRHIKAECFPKPIYVVQGGNAYFSNRRIFEFCRHGVMDDGNSLGN